jgi:hypothetical protein
VVDEGASNGAEVLGFENMPRDDNPSRIALLGFDDIVAAIESNKSNLAMKAWNC